MMKLTGQPLKSVTFSGFLVLKKKAHNAVKGESMRERNGRRPYVATNNKYNRNIGT